MWVKSLSGKQRDPPLAGRDVYLPRSDCHYEKVVQFLCYQSLFIHMKKYILGAILSLGLLVSPAFSQAAGLTNTQVQAILSLLSSFGADQSVINNVQTSLTGGAPTTGGQSWCHTFNSNFGIGTRSAEIAALQTALSRAGNDTGTGSSDPTPLFNEQVAAAVTGFQEKYASEILTPNGLQHGTGYVGASTRMKLNSLYGCSDPVPVSSFLASPTYGSAPLAVSFSYNLGGSLVSESSYSITFGDGTTGAVTLGCGNVGT